MTEIFCVLAFGSCIQICKAGYDWKSKPPQVRKLFQDKKDYHYHFSSEEKKHTRSYKLNDNQFTVSFYSKLIFFKKNQVVAKWKKNPVWKHKHGWGLQKLFKIYHQVPLKAK